MIYDIYMAERKFSFAASVLGFQLGFFSVLCMQSSCLWMSFKEKLLVHWRKTENKEVASSLELNTSNISI